MLRAMLPSLAVLVTLAGTGARPATAQSIQAMPQAPVKTMPQVGSKAAPQVGVYVPTTAYYGQPVYAAAQSAAALPDPVAGRVEQLEKNWIDRFGPLKVFP